MHHIKGKVLSSVFVRLERSQVRVFAVGFLRRSCYTEPSPNQPCSHCGPRCDAAFSNWCLGSTFHVSGVLEEDMSRVLVARSKSERTKSGSAALVPALVLFACFGAVQQAAGQSLQPFKNYFVTGDYVVGGVGLRGLGSGGFATGTINIPDKNTPTMSVPDGADVVAAFLYWQTVEKSQSALAGQSGFFNGFPISGNILG